MSPMKKLLLAILLVAGLFEVSKAQDLAVKTDLSSDIFTNINIGGEVGLAPQMDIGRLRRVQCLDFQRPQALEALVPAA